MFFESIVDALKLLHSDQSNYLANESNKLCRAILFKVLIKVAYRNLSPDLTEVPDS